MSLGLMTGDIWSTGAFSFESPLKDLLDSDDYTLEQLLAEDELLQELRGLHPKLIAYLASPGVVTKLVEYVILPPSESSTSSIWSSSSTTTAAAGMLHTSPTTEKLLNGLNGAKSKDDGAAEDMEKPLDDRPSDPRQWLQRQQLNQGDGDEGDDKKKDKAEEDLDMLHVRYPFMACEIICCELPGIINLLVEGYVPRTGGGGSTEEEKKEVEDGKAGNDEDEAERRTGHQQQVDQFISEGDHPNVELVNRQNAEGGKEEATSQPPTKILDLLFSVLHDTPEGELDDYRAGYFEKILRVLFKKRPDEMTEYVDTGGSYGREALIRAMFRHLYSHSIMLVAQRLLLPQRPKPLKGAPQGKGGEDGDEGAEHDDETSDDATPPGGGGDDDGDDDEGQIEEGEIKSDWSNSPEALDLLLDSLTGGGAEGASSSLSPEEEERRLDLSLNASEVLITVIQNSLLSSNAMLSLTASDVLERLILAASTVTATNEDGEEYFSPHESLLTTSMSVLESLILQLGGYGAVGTLSLLPEGEVPGVDVEEEKTAVNAGDAATPSPARADVAPFTAEDPDHLIADLSTLVEHLPLLLDNFSYLLQHPSTYEWKTCTQYAKDEPQPMIGSSRLRIVRVLEALVLLGDPDVDSRLIQSDCLEVCLNLFWDFQWCSVLHQSVANLLVHVFEGRNARVDMQEYFLIRCNILVRLMDSFAEAQYSPTRTSEVVMNMDDVNIGDTAPSESDKGSSNPDPLPVSEDDVDAVLEKESDVERVSTEAVQYESRDASTAGNGGAPPQSFRFGYMGHVIIICQALVHACREDDEDESEQQKTDDGNMDSGASKASSSEGAFSKEPLFLAEMVACHPLSDKWNEFVATTLANETSVQSTPLGGYTVSGTAGGDPLHSHRPGLPDDTNPLGGGSAGHGILTGGEPYDMDDNDLDIAASMMANLSLTRASRPGPDVDDDDECGSGSGDSERSYNSGETNNSGGYLFDDPLGQLNGGLGIALDKLTKFKPGDKKEKNEEVDGDASSSDEASNSSSDEEPEKAESDTDDVPVLDLFAGNFDYESNGQPQDSADSDGEAAPDWSNFANFDDAFAGEAVTGASSGGGGGGKNAGNDVDDFGAFMQAEDPSTEEQPGKPNSSTEIESIFGGGDHSSLLEADPFAEDTADSDLGPSKPSSLSRRLTSSGDLKPETEVTSEPIVCELSLEGAEGDAGISVADTSLFQQNEPGPQMFPTPEDGDDAAADSKHVESSGGASEQLKPSAQEEEARTESSEQQSS